MSSKTSLTKGNWMCPDESCGNMNFPKRDKCNRCGKKKKEVTKVGIEIGKAVAEKSKGLFSADDWMCKSCGNINWARRTACNICNTSKVNTQGQRTGYGGGFYEREETVEYIDRNDSDDEYDEFGMKKKKYRGHLAQDNENDKNDDSTDKDSEADPQNEGKEEEEDDEDVDEPEEDSDGGDLSKYDLWGDDENDVKQPIKSIEIPPKRSRSHSTVSTASSSSSGSSSDSSDSSESSSSDSSPKKAVDGELAESKKPRKQKIEERSRSRSPVDRREKKH